MSSENAEISKAFELFNQNGTGKIDPKEIKLAMQSLGYDEKNPTMYQVRLIPERSIIQSFPLLLPSHRVLTSSQMISDFFSILRRLKSLMKLSR